jgi:hypothetical protein
MVNAWAGFSRSEVDQLLEEARKLGVETHASANHDASGLWI